MLFHIYCNKVIKHDKPHADGKSHIWSDRVPMRRQPDQHRSYLTQNFSKQSAIDAQKVFEKYVITDTVLQYLGDIRAIDTSRLVNRPHVRSAVLVFVVPK